MSSNQIDFKLRPIRRVFWLAVGALALALPLFTSGCGPTAAATEFAPLAAGWPTPGFADATPTPTLFPRVTWAPGETPVVWKEATTATPNPSATPPVVADSSSQNPADGAPPASTARPVVENEAARSASGRSAAPLPGPRGRLVIQSSSGGPMFVVNADGSGLRQLGGGMDPAVSPDGSQVAFTRWGPGELGGLWVLDLNTGEERQVLGETKQAKHPAWSPDGKRIVVNFQHEGRMETKQVCKDMSVPEYEAPDIPWNADPDEVKVKWREGKPFLCWELPPDPHWGLRVVDVADGSYADMPADSYAFGPEWDPANSWRIVSSGGNGLVQLDVNRMEAWQLTDRREDHSPTFSPDGRFVAVAFNNGGRWQIQRLNADGGGRKVLTHIPMSAIVDGIGPWNDTAPAWSPVCGSIAFLTDRTGRWEVWVMDAEGDNQRPMFGEELQAQLGLEYRFVDERMISWTK